jgi:hypothetical protein
MFESSVLEGLLRQAVIDDINREADKWEEISRTSPPIQFSHRHNRRMKTIFAETKRLIHKRESYNEIPIGLRRFARKLAYAAAMILVVFNLLVLSVPAVRAAAGQAVVSFFEKFANFNQTVSSQTGSFDTGFRPKFVPNGFNEISCSITDSIVTIIYCNEFDEMISFVYASDTDLLQVNSEDVDYVEIVSNNIAYYLFTANSDDYVNMIVWDKDGLRYSVDGNIPLNELLMIAESVE